MSMRLMTLGVMYREQKTHGYTVYHELLSWQADTWTKIRPGSIYHALSQLAKEGLISNQGEAAGSKGSSKTLYAMLPSGEEELKRLVRQALLSYDQEEFTAGLAFMSVLTRAEAIALSEQRLRMHKETVAFMKTLPQSEAPATPAEHPAIIGSWTSIFKATLLWQQQFVKDLRAGRYGFSGD